MDEAMKYCMEYIPSSKREIHKQEEKAALDDKTECGYPIDKKGKDYLLPSLQYQQARKWVLRKSSKNVEWERKYETYLQSFKSRDTNLVYVNLRRCQRNTNEDDEPFILAFEAAQVFYCKDLSRDNWHVVLHAPKRLNHDVDVYEDPLVFEAMVNSDGLASALMGDIDGVEV
ncbi:hypothetical protein IFM89_015031 [Coptis chinensis]|uniref:DUF4216 domain-containing protein n=1 Tax=Coptis chinensis TaxID=261450 RepID=A0A835LVJ4_9MAGN|nr:hypothetical protein IFM89_015031 [Coptis chinensis]